MEYEQVHPTKSWEDFKRRLNEDRRVFIFTHRLLPGEPLVILHTALGDHLRFNMEVHLYIFALLFLLHRRFSPFGQPECITRQAELSYIDQYLRPWITQLYGLKLKTRMTKISLFAVSTDILVQVLITSQLIFKIYFQNYHQISCYLLWVISISIF